MTFEFAKDGIEYALFHSVPAFQALYHFPVGMRIFQVHVEIGRIGDAALLSLLSRSITRLNLVILVKDPHASLSQRLWIEPDMP